MTALVTAQIDDEDMLSMAASHGFTLHQRDNESGKPFLGWLRDGDSHAPHFMTRKEAMYWMYKWLTDNGFAA